MKDKLKEECIELVVKKMWVWYNRLQSDATLEFVVLKSDKNNNYLIKTNSHHFCWYDNASDTNPNE